MKEGPRELAANTPHNDGGEQIQPDFPEGIHQRTKDQILEAVRKHMGQSTRLPSIKGIARRLIIRPLDLYESLYRMGAEESHSVLVEMLPSVRLKQYPQYVQIRSVIEQLRNSKSPYYIRDLAKKLGIFNETAFERLVKLGHARKAFGFSDGRKSSRIQSINQTDEHTVSPQAHEGAFEGILRRYADAIHALARSGEPVTALSLANYLSLSHTRSVNEQSVKLVLAQPRNAELLEIFTRAQKGERG